MEQSTISEGQPMLGAPLQQISQDRINKLGLPQSPSMPTLLSEKLESHSRRGSDVRAKIAFFSNNYHGNTSTNSFAISGSPTRSPMRSAFSSPTKSHSRANSVISLPTDSSEVAGIVQALQIQLEQSRGRERLVAERVESLMEQLQSAHSRSKYEHKENEKELKAMKRQVHKAELALIKCQQELQEARNEQEGFKVRAEHERQSKEKARQESFERARTLASNLEELEFVKRERDVLRSENETLMALQNSMTALSAQAQSKTATSDVSVQVDVEPIATSCSESADLFHPQRDSATIEDLKEELDWLRSQLKREEELVHFMNMQCQFRTCPCRMAERAGVRFVHDYAYDQRQQELAKLKGTKRKAEDELPLPQYKTFRECLDQTSRERKSAHLSAGSRTEAVSHSTANESSTTAFGQSHFVHNTEVVEDDDEPTLRAKALKSPKQKAEYAGVIPLHEAADIPLPSPRSDDLEPTILLEDMTQVIVEPEPLASSKHFAFSTSTSSRYHAESDTPLFRQSHSTMSNTMSDDLFDIRPPRHLPPRPSTSMGLRSVDSPIRMVPPSPEHRQSLTPRASPPRHRTMQVPLKDSPLKNSITQRRSHSRPRSQIEPKSPTPGPIADNANSPAAETWPITPKQKMERPSRTQLQNQSNKHLHPLHPEVSNASNTIRIALHDVEVVSGFTHDPRPADHAQTQPLSIDVNYQGRQPLHESDPNINAQSAMLIPGTPITREAALAQIRARRDRARSIARGKQGDDGSATKTPKSVARRGVILTRETVIRDISNLSQVSAPARF